MAPLSDTYLERRRQEILAAAQRVFVDKGYEAATVSDIAAAAGVATGSIYRYFANKADLIAAVANRCIDEDLERWQVQVSGRTPGEALLNLGLVTKRDFVSEGHLDEATLRLESYLAGAREPELRERLTASLDESVAALEAFIERAQASGEFDETYDAADFSRFLHAAASGISALSVLYGETFPKDRAWDLLIRLVGECFRGDLGFADALDFAGGRGDLAANRGTDGAGPAPSEDARPETATQEGDR